MTTTNEAWGRQLRLARDAWEEKHRRKLPYAEIGRRVAELARRPKPYSHPAVSAWFEKGTQPESFDVIRAIIQVLEGSPADFGAVLLAAVPITQNPPAERAGSKRKETDAS